MSYTYYMLTPRKGRNNAAVRTLVVDLVTGAILGAVLALSLWLAST